MTTTTSPWRSATIFYWMFLFPSQTHFKNERCFVNCCNTSSIWIASSLVGVTIIARTSWIFHFLSLIKQQNISIEKGIMGLILSDIYTLVFFDENFNNWNNKSKSFAWTSHLKRWDECYWKKLSTCQPNPTRKFENRVPS